ncbi:FG-GAP repeat protein [Steroidobacter sp.]|uniref:FG-GAP repeat protein n=1 Tax=Steroidobacter sp. TaxID=1978227 RepID=UPI0025E80C08|nr:FG-GAP repeat protein [Steroidobacter sp.]
MFAAANTWAGPISRHIPARSIAQLDHLLRPQPWETSAQVLTSEYEYHEPTNQSRNQQYGMQLALSGDGRTLAVADIWYFGGSEWPWYGSGAVYVYRRTNNSWVLEAKLEPPAARGYDFFGTDVALSLTGNTLAVGAQNEGYDAPSQDAGPGSVFVFKRRNGVWKQEAMLRASRPQDVALFGRSVEISALGDVIAVGAPYESVDNEGAEQPAAGAAYIFAKRDGVWVEQQALTAPSPQRSDWFGWGVRLSEDGRTVAVLAAEQNPDTEDWDLGGWPGRDNVIYVFQRQSGVWSSTAGWEGSAAEPHFGGNGYEAEGQSEGFDLNVDGRVLVIGSPYAEAPDGTTGLARVFRRPGKHWLPTAKVLVPALPDRRSFGSRLTLSANGQALVAFADRDDGAYGQPFVVAFDLQRNRWRQSALIESPTLPNASGFANSLALSWSGQRLAVGARSFNTEETYWGAALTYRREARAPRPGGK